MKSKNSLIQKIWKYLIIFSITILSFLWLFQVIFLDSYYVWVKYSDIDRVSSKIEKNIESKDLIDILDTLSYEKDVCISIIANNEEYYSSNLSRGCLNNLQNKMLYEKYKLEFIKTNEEKTKYRIVDSKYQTKFLLMGQKLDNNIYVFISTSLEPISSTTYILTTQLVYVTMLVLVLSLVISYFISKKISDPIININKNARKMAKGDYDVNFETDSNISEIIELSETLNEAKNELEMTDEIRKELIANVSHDLKTPLTMIKAYAEMVRDLTYDDKEKRESNLNTIIKETDRLNLLVNDVLELSKAGSNKIKLNRENFDLNKLIQNILEKFDYLKEQEKYNFIYEYNKKIMVNADKKQIEQVLYNLISNATKYVGEDKIVQIKITENKATYLVEVIDHGCGINKKDLKLIWDKYYKIDKTHQRSTNGTGLGLSIVKSILIKHKFDYGVNSTVGKGTTFYFEIDKKI